MILARAYDSHQFVPVDGGAELVDISRFYGEKLVSRSNAPMFGVAYGIAFEELVEYKLFLALGIGVIHDSSQCLATEPVTFIGSDHILRLVCHENVVSLGIVTVPLVDIV